MKTNLLSFKHFNTYNALLLGAAMLLTPIYLYTEGTDLQVVDDIATTQKNTSVIIDVMANDPQPDEYNFFLSAQPANGNVIKTVPQGMSQYVFVYYPNTDFVGVDTFTYTRNLEVESFSFEASVADEATVTVTVKEDSMDTDKDGTPDSKETGDVNGDGIADKDQPNVIAVGDAGKYFVKDDDCDLITLTSDETYEGEEYSSVVAGYGFSADCTDNSMDVEIGFGITSESYNNLTDAKIYKNGLSPAGIVEWFDFTENVTVDTTGTYVKISYTLTDGGIGDDGANGVITDPIVIADENDDLERTGGIF